MCSLLVFWMWLGKDPVAVEAGPLPVAYGMEVLAVPDFGTAGKMDGKGIWQHKFAMPGAPFLKVHFASFQLDGDDKVVIYSKNKQVEVLTGLGH